MTHVIENQNQPLASLDEWEDDLLRRYPNPEDIATSKATEAYRNYEEPARDTVKEFYRLNHTHQSFAFVKEKQKEYLFAPVRDNAHYYLKYRKMILGCHLPGHLTNA